MYRPIEYEEHSLHGKISICRIQSNDARLTYQAEFGISREPRMVLDFYRNEWWPVAAH